MKKPLQTTKAFSLTVVLSFSVKSLIAPDGFPVPSVKFQTFGQL
jgi:hypothetical protein